MSGTYFYPIKRIFLNLSGGTVTGDTVFTSGLSSDTFNLISSPLTANTAQNLLVRDFDGSIKIREASSFLTGVTLQNLQDVISIGSTASTPSDVFIESTLGNIIFQSNSSSLIIDDKISATTISMSGDIEAEIDNAYDIGSPIRRFRSLNTVNGVAVNFTASTRITTNEIVLGNQTLTENNVILTGQTIDGGDW